MKTSIWPFISGPCSGSAHNINIPLLPMHFQSNLNRSILVLGTHLTHECIQRFLEGIVFYRHISQQYSHKLHDYILIFEEITCIVTFQNMSPLCVSSNRAFKKRFTRIEIQLLKITSKIVSVKQIHFSAINVIAPFYRSIFQLIASFQFHS